MAELMAQIISTTAKTNRPRKRNASNNESMLKAICDQRQKLEQCLTRLIEACDAAIAARAFVKDKEIYRLEIMVRAAEAKSCLIQDHPDRPRFNYKSIPDSVSSKKKYRCSLDWFCNRLAVLLMDFTVGDKLSQHQAKRIQKALETIKYIGLDTIGYGHSSWEEADLLEECIKEQKASKKQYDFTRKMPLNYIVNELCRFMNDYSPMNDYPWIEAKVYREEQEALLSVCLATLRLNPTNIFKVYKKLSTVPTGQKNFSSRAR